MRFLGCLLILLFTGQLIAQEFDATQIIEKSIHYHDPHNYFGTAVISFELTEERPNGSNRHTHVSIDIPNKQFVAERKVDEIETTIQWIDTSFHCLLNGESNFSDSLRIVYRLTRERSTSLRNYYTYLWLMPMKLKDAGAVIHKKVGLVDFFGAELLELKVTYTPEVGADIWYFYFHPETFALSGYRFYHDEVKNDGEYILLENEVEYKGMRIPQNRSWFTHGEKKYLGRDVLNELIVTIE